jgi:hypothetical protein
MLHNFQLSITDLDLKFNNGSGSPTLHYDQMVYSIHHCARHGSGALPGTWGNWGQLGEGGWVINVKYVHYSVELSFCLFQEKIIWRRNHLHWSSVYTLLFISLWTIMKCGLHHQKSVLAFFHLPQFQNNIVKYCVLQICCKMWNL